MIHQRKAFTMVELIFILVVIGILAAVAIPKLVGNRADATAKVCEIEAAGLLNELAEHYAKHSTFDTLENMSNIRVGVIGEGNNGIKEVGAITPSTIVSVTYVCNGEDVVLYKPTESTYTDRVNTVHNQMGLVTEMPAVVPTTLEAKIVISDFTNRGFYKSDPGYVVGGR